MKGYEMKKAVMILMMVLALGLASNAYGAEFSYKDDSVTLDLLAGESATTDVTVSSANQTTGLIYFNMAGSVESGNLPAGWVKSAVARMMSTTREATVTLSVNVPADAQEGTYFGTVKPSIMMSRETVDVGKGVYVVVEVKPSCQGNPTLNGTISPAEISMRNHKLVDISVTGQVTVPEGCVLSGVTYSLEDEYGEYNSNGPVTVGADGSFSISAAVEASRRGEDKDGRVYTISVKAIDKMGNTAGEGYIVTVAHDNGKSK